MAQLVIRAAAAVVGFYIGGPTGAQIGWALGGFIAPPNKVQGAHLEDLSAPRLAYGAAIPRLYGRHRFSATPIWASELQPHESTTSAGKGGGTEVTNTTYTLDMLLLLDIDTPIVGVARVWLNKKLVYNIGPDASDTTLEASIETAKWTALEVFDGNAAQLPWSVYEAAVGIGNAPAYRHRSTIGITGLDCGAGGQPPLLEFEIYTAGTVSDDFYIDNFTDGKDPYTGDLAFFNADVMEFGPVLGVIAVDNDSGSGEVIDRTIDTVSGTRLSIFFRLGSVLAQGDSGVFVLKQGISQRVVLFPARDLIANPDRSPMLTIDAETVELFPTGLPLFTWYQLLVVFVPGVNNTHAQLFDVTNGTFLLQDTTLSGDHAGITVDTIEFQADSADGGGSAQFARLRIFGDPGTIEQVDLADIVTAECERVGLTSIDVIDITGIPVTGYATTKACRPTLEELAGMYYFEAYCDDVLHFVRRGGASTETLTYEETGAGIDRAGDPFNGMDRGDELAVPAFYVVQFPDITRDYEPGSVMSDRLVGQSSEIRQIQGAVVMTPSEAKGRADSFSLDARVASHSGVIDLSVGHLARTPTDVMTATDVDGTTYRARIVRQTYSDLLVLHNEVVLDDATALRDSGVAPPDGDPAIEVEAPGTTLYDLIDGPILRGVDDDAGMYLATRINGSGAGSRFFKSVDGVTYNPLFDVTTDSIAGTAQDALGDFTGGYVWDEINTVRLSTTDDLSSSTKSAMQADLTINSAALSNGDDWEYFRFRTATLDSDGYWTLSGLLRGMRGTERFISGHASGDKFILFGFNGFRRVPGDVLEIGLERFYKGVTLGQSLDAVGARAFTNDAVGLLPFSPVGLRADRDTSGNITFTWRRRTRLDVRYVGPGGILAPLGEDSESYQVDIYDSGTVVRTISASSESAAYSAAEQTTDFGGTLAAGNCDAEVFQISATVGRGIGRRKSV